MQKHNLTRLRKALTLHTGNCLFDWCDYGYGPKTDKVIRSSDRIENLVDRIVNEECKSAVENLPVHSIL